MRKTFLIVPAVLLTLALPQASKSFSDVSSSTTQYGESISALQKSGVIEGYEDGTFRPSSTINRAEFLKIVLEGRSDNQIFTGKECFPDVDTEWFAKYVCSAKKEGIIGGYPDGNFRPDREINFVEASKILSLAFEQDPQSGGREWYEAYVRALEGSKAIPISIDALEKFIDRGEMVEMMWRLTEGIDDEPSTTLMNIRHPDIGIDLSADEPVVATSCKDIRAFAEDANQGYGKYHIMDGDVMMMPTMMRSMGVAEEAGDSASFSGTTGGSGGTDFSETNIQVEGVDEADIVKTDGTYVYIIRNQHLTIVDARSGSNMEIVYNHDFSGDGFTPQELYLTDDGYVLIGNSWTQHTTFDEPMPMAKTTRMMRPSIWPGPTYQTHRTQVRTYTFIGSDAQLTRTVSFEGNKVSSRKIGDQVYMVLNQGLNWYRPMPLAEADDRDLLPKFSDSAVESSERSVVDCNDVVILPRVPSPQYLIVASIPVSDTKAPVEREMIIGNGQNVYMSLNNLFVASTDYNYVWRAGASSSSEKTRIYRFGVSKDGLKFRGQGSVPGRILNQFSMDEWNETFRIATTKGNMWNENNPSTSNLYVLNMAMEQVGSIEGIAPGEQIYSVRFMGERAYMVTFKKVDPFFVIDTADPRNPRILGKLKIPGYSDYLHPFDKNHIIGFGKEAVEAKEGDFAWYQGMKIALFDVTDVKNPRELHKLDIGDRGTNSPLLHNHKALLFEKDRNLMAFPVQINEIPQEQKSEYTGSAHGTPVFQGAVAYKLTLKNGFRELGRVSHYTEEDMQKSGSYLYGKNVQRVLRIGEQLLTVSEVGVQKHNLDGITKEDGILYTEAEANSCPDPEEVFYVSEDPDTCAVVDFFCNDDQEAFSNSCGCGCT